MQSASKCSRTCLDTTSRRKTGESLLLLVKLLGHHLSYFNFGYGNLNVIKLISLGQREREGWVEERSLNKFVSDDYWDIWQNKSKLWRVNKKFFLNDCLCFPLMN